jgi:hypothetical protein
MPRLALDMLLGRPLPDDLGVFREIGMVRVWREHFVTPSEIEALEQLAPIADEQALNVED